MVSWYAGDEWCDDETTSGPLEERHDLAADRLADLVDGEDVEILEIPS